MQPLRFSGFPTVHPSFQRHRRSIDHSRFSLNLSLCSNKNAPTWASLPTPPMSGSPPPEPSKDPAQLAGRRRKRSDTPPNTTVPSIAVTLPSLLDNTTQRYGEQPPSSRSYEGPTMQLAPQPIPYLPPLLYGAGSGAPLAHYSNPDLSVTTQQISPRTTRKTKAHVASACINCKKKHLRCDSSRPCRRCVQSGKEDTCRDVEHKKRGRPPLKPEDPTIMGRRTGGHASLGVLPEGFASRLHHGSDPRGYVASNYPPILPNNIPPPVYGHQRTSSSSSLYRGFLPPYAPPSVAHSPLTVSAMGGFSYPTRPPSTSSTLSMQSASPYIPHPTYPSQAVPRQTQPYTNYPFHQVEMPPTTQPYYSNPIFPREQAPPSIQTDNLYPNTLQLPPIRPSQPSMSESSVTQQRQVGQHHPVQQQARRDESGERDPKRPKMDIQGILGPKHD